ncbi:hypothetical protein E0Z10_g9256 [Xylaria hypoxylon]|uniref:Carrier domain-containing protein n=1 Tax=Xylaria hypoxylon TaxID=37992 RepID=A0A4Z0Y643_9PEZI|nr:hypothetical protein E0Z10_g9256 [Xylaria hypoxylon]
MNTVSANPPVAQQGCENHTGIEAPRQPTSVCDLVDQWARERPDHTAVLFESRRVSYKALNDAASRIAWLLIRKHVKPGDVIPVLATRTCEMVASFLGVLKTGACYVPIDVEAWGEERTASTLERVSARIVVNLGNSVFPGYDVISRHEIEQAFESTEPAEQDSNAQLPQAMIKPTDLVYIVFTSGTTSRPKGVMIPHRALLNYVEQGDEEAPFNTFPRPEDKTLLTFSPGFDAGTGVIFSTICNGAQLMVASTADFESCATQATIIAITPSMLSAIHNIQACSQLRTLILGGEPPHQRLVEKWTAPGRNIYNGYGPTETTVGSLMGRVELSKPITLGHPMSNSRVILLDEDTESDYGEICLTGPGLAVGYYQDETLTAQKFVYWQGERMYRTGDFARRTEHGLEYAGRADSFVKNRGFLLNIDSQVIPILLHAEVQMATAFMHCDRLMAFVTPDSIDTRAFRQSLLQNHDAFLVPDQIRAVPILPLTPNGKADNRALRQLLEAETSDRKDGTEQDGDLRPRSKLETLKMAISEATSLPLSEVLDDLGFSELGGNSLAALKVLSYLRSRHMKLSIRSLFDLPNLGAMSDAIQEQTSMGNQAMDLLEETKRGEIHNEEDRIVGPMTALQTKMIQASLKTPGANTMLLRIHIPHPDATPNKASLKEAWFQVLHRHAIFRTVFLLRDGLQQVEPGLKLSWSEEETTVDQLNDVVQTRSLSIHKRIVDLDMQGEIFIPVNVFHLVTVPKVGSALLFSAHHAQADGWSLSIILDEVQAILSGGKVPIEKKTLQFTNIALAQNQQQSNPEGTSFWANVLKSHSALPRFNLPKPPPSQKSCEWTRSAKLDLGFTLVELEQGARFLRVTPSTLLYAAWGLVLSNYTSSDRVAFGAVFSGRNLPGVPGLEGAVGPLLNTVPFPMDQLFHMLEFQWSAAEAMATMTGESINGTLQTLVVTEYDLPPSKDSSWAVDREDMMEFALTLLLERSSGGEYTYSSNEENQDLQARILFDSSKYAQSSIPKLLAHFRNALCGLLNRQNIYVRDVRSQIMDEQEKQALLLPLGAFDQETKPDLSTENKTVKDAFESAVSNWPDSCAIETRHGSVLSYLELDEGANRVARELRRRSQGTPLKDIVIGVISDGSPHWVIAILAVLKAGYICCPIDVSLPARRIETIIRQSGASGFLSATRTCADKVDLGENSHDTLHIVVDEFLRTSPNAPAGQLQTSTETQDVVYLVFTSGSTGVPKGVPLHNLSILNFLDVPEIRLFTKPGRRISQLCALGFDMVLVELFACLCYGGTLVLKDPNDPFEQLKRVNAMVATPSLLSAFSPEDYTNLDVVLLAGEVLPQTLADTWAGKIPTLLNLYGPSECGCVSTGTRIIPAQSVSIGRPIPGLHIYILDHQQYLVPQGITGEIYISGVQLTRGYWGDAHEEKTKRLFIPNPFSSDPSNRIMYRTGDLGFWNEEMNISYVGRVDSMVKVRGFRVELEEVENALVAADKQAVKSAAAIVIGGESGNTYANGNRIVGFVTPADVDLTVLRAKIAILLPIYARPSQLLAVPELPKTANLKLDRERLKDLVLAAQTVTKPGEEGTHEIEEHNALSPTESLIAEIWKKLLGLIDGVRIHKGDDFISLGGNSILAIKAARSITISIGHSIPVALLIRETILERLASSIDQAVISSLGTSPTADGSFSSYLSSVHGSDSADGHPAHHPARLLPLSYLENEIFQAYVTSKFKSPFNTVAQFTVSGLIDLNTLTEAFAALVRENPLLRSRYFVSEQQRVRVVSAKVTAPEHFADNELNLQRLQAIVDKPFDLAKDQPLRVVFWETSGASRETQIILITHHIATDKASLALMLQWVSHRYGQSISRKIPSRKNSDEPDPGESNNSSTKSSTYLEWAQWLAQKQQHNDIAPQSQTRKQERILFWKHHLRHMQTIPQLQASDPTDLMGSPGSTSSIRIPPLDATKKRESTNRYSQRIAVAATALALRAVFGNCDLVLGLPYINRDEPATVDMLGVFVDRLPIRIMLDNAILKDTIALLDAVSTEISLCLDNYLPYVEIQGALGNHNNMQDRRAIVDVMILYGWRSDTLEHSLSLGPGVQITEARNGVRPSGSLFPLDFEFVEELDGGLSVNITNNTDLVSPEKMAALESILPRAVQGLVQGLEPVSILASTTISIGS